MGELLDRAGAVGRDAGDGRRPGRTEGEVDDDVALAGPAQSGFDGVGPGAGTPAVSYRVDGFGEAVGDRGDLDAAESGGRDLIDLALDLVAVDQRVRPPPAELGPDGSGRVGEAAGEGALGGGAAGRGGRRGGRGPLGEGQRGEGTGRRGHPEDGPSSEAAQRACPVVRSGSRRRFVPGRLSGARSVLHLATLLVRPSARMPSERTDMQVLTFQYPGRKIRRPPRRPQEPCTTSSPTGAASRENRCGAVRTTSDETPCATGQFPAGEHPGAAQQGALSRR